MSEYKLFGAVLSSGFHCIIIKFPLDPQILQEGGIFSLGGLIPRPIEMWETVANSTFVGFVDEVKVWSRSLDIYDVMQSSQLRFNDSMANLSASWSFCEGSGYTTWDSVANLTFR